MHALYREVSSLPSYHIGQYESKMDDFFIPIMNVIGNNFTL